MVRRETCRLGACTQRLVPRVCGGHRPGCMLLCHWLCQYRVYRGQCPLASCRPPGHSPRAKTLRSWAAAGSLLPPVSIYSRGSSLCLCVSGVYGVVRCDVTAAPRNGGAAGGCVPCGGRLRQSGRIGRRRPLVHRARPATSSSVCCARYRDAHSYRDRGHIAVKITGSARGVRCGVRRRIEATASEFAADAVSTRRVDGPATAAGTVGGRRQTDLSAAGRLRQSGGRTRRSQAADH